MSLQHPPHKPHLILHKPTNHTLDKFKKWSHNLTEPQHPPTTPTQDTPHSPCSARTKLAELTNSLKNNNVDIVMLQETWQTDPPIIKGYTTHTTFPPPCPRPHGEAEQGEAPPHSLPTTYTPPKYRPRRQPPSQHPPGTAKSSRLHGGHLQRLQSNQHTILPRSHTQATRNHGSPPNNNGGLQHPPLRLGTQQHKHQVEMDPPRRDL